MWVTQLPQNPSIKVNGGKRKTLHRENIAKVIRNCLTHIPKAPMNRKDFRPKVSLREENRTLDKISGTP